MCSKSSSTISIPQLPDISFLSEDERKIIEAVLEKQKLDEQKNSFFINKQQSLDLSSSSYNHSFSNNSLNQSLLKHKKQSVNDIAAEVKQRYGDMTIDTGPQCDICKKTKFISQTSGQICVYCKLKCCIRCGVKYKAQNKQIWICSQCKSKTQIPKSSTSNGMPTQPAKTRLLNHMDSLSSDPSDYVSINNNNKSSNNNNNNNSNASATQLEQQKTPKRVLPQITKQSSIDLHNNSKKQQKSTPNSKQHSLSSSDEDFDVDEDLDEELRSTTEYTTGDEMDVESNSLISERLNRRNIDDYLDQNLGKEEILAAKMKKFLSPTTWKLSPDSKSLIGHLNIKRNMPQMSETSLSLGCKIVGGKSKPDGTLGAFIEKIKKGSLCETLYNLKCGDEILEWNSIKFKNLSYDEVFNVISQSKTDNQIELIIERKLLNQIDQHKSSINSNNDILQNQLIRNKPSNKSNLFGRLQLKMSHDSIYNKLTVTLININCLQNQMTSVFSELYLLPNRNKTDMLRTSDTINFHTTSKSYIFNNQTFIYENVTSFEINSNLFLKIILFDKLKQKAILGQCTIKLRDSNLKNELQSHLLIYNTSSEDLSSNETLSTQFSVSRVLPKPLINDNQQRPVLVKQLTNESSNENLSVSATPKRRQLPQVPLNQQQIHRNKIAHDLEEKARRIKLETVEPPKSQQPTPQPIPSPKQPQFVPIIQTTNNQNEIKSQNKFIPIRSASPIPNNTLLTTTTHRLPYPQTQTQTLQSQNIDRYNNNDSPPLVLTRSQQHLPQITNENLNLSNNKTIRSRSHGPVTQTPSTNINRMPVMRDVKQRISYTPQRHPVNSSITTPNVDYDSEGSEFSTISKISSTSIMSTQSERPSKNLTNTNRSSIKAMSHIDEKPAKHHQSCESELNNQVKQTPLPQTQPPLNSTQSVETNKNDGTLSDSALTPANALNDKQKRRASMAKALVILGLSKKSNSACNLTLGKRFGFARSEEIGVVPELRNTSANKTENETPNGNANMSNKQNLWSGALQLPHEQQYSDFVDGLGPGQKVGRQVLGSPCLGEVQMSVVVEKGQLVVEIIRARNLKLKSGYRLLPAAYVKLYLFEGRSCVEKLKTCVARRTLEPMYQEVLRFQQYYRDRILQVTVWGDYGKLDRKVFMGVAQIVLNDLNLNSMVIGWYKLYSASSLMQVPSTATTGSSSSSNNLAGTESVYSLDSQNTVK